MSAGQSHRLSVYGQMAPRAYLSTAMCFPFPKSSSLLDRFNAINHLMTALEELAKQRPDLAGDLHLGSTPEEGPFVYLRFPEESTTGEKPTIPLGAAKHEEIRYELLKNLGFPPVAFVMPDFALDGDIPKHDATTRLPVVRVTMRFISGGVCLCIYLHHAYADISGLDLVTTALAAATRSVTCQHPSNCTLALPSSSTAETDPRPLEAQLEDFPEYIKLPTPFGPTQPYLLGGMAPDDIFKSGKIFVFKLAQLNQLRDALAMSVPEGSTPKLPSSYSVLSALTWAHTAKARQAEQDAPKDALSKPAMFSNPVMWKDRVYQAEAKDYSGPTTLWTVAIVDTSKVMAATSDQLSLAHLAQEIEAANNEATTEAYIQKRTDLFTTLKDPRYVGLNVDPRMPQNLSFNTWQHLSTHAKWNIPGVKENGEPVTQPDAIRRIQAEWDLGGGLILPAKQEADEIELLITLPSTSMLRLCADKEWMKQVDRIVG